MLLPDVEEVLTGWLASRSELTGVLIATRLPINYDGSQKVVRIVRLGGGTDYLAAIDYPRVDIDCFAADKGSASDLNRIVRQLMHQDIHTADLSRWSAAISRTHEDVGPIWLDDPDYPPSGHYLIQMAIAIRAV